MYSIKQSKEGDLLLIIEPQSCDPDCPLFIYDDYSAPIRIVCDVKSLIAG